MDQTHVSEEEINKAKIESRKKFSNIQHQNVKSFKVACVYVILTTTIDIRKNIPHENLEYKMAFWMKWHERREKASHIDKSPNVNNNEKVKIVSKFCFGFKLVIQLNSLVNFYFHYRLEIKIPFFSVIACKLL